MQCSWGAIQIKNYKSKILHIDINQKFIRSFILQPNMALEPAQPGKGVFWEPWPVLF